MEVEDFRNGNRSFPEVDELMEKLLSYKDEDYYPSSDAYPKMVPLRRWIRDSRSESVGVFPGGNGVRHGVAEVPKNGVLVVLHDFDVLVKYENAVRHGYTRQEDVTSLAICKLIEASGINTRDCFFTNRFMGVRDAPSQYGPNPGRTHAPFVRLSDEILKITMDLLAPRLVLLFGQHVPRSLGLHSLWRRDYVTHAVLYDHAVVVASLTHTSLRTNWNLRNVTFGGKLGHAAELEILRVAADMAGITTRQIHEENPNSRCED